PAAAPVAAAAPAPADRREEAVLAYLRGSRELIEAQRDVLLGFLGAGSPAPRPSAEAPDHPWATPVGALAARGAELPGRAGTNGFPAGGRGPADGASDHGAARAGRAAPGLWADPGGAAVPSADGWATAGGGPAQDTGSEAGPRSADEVMDVVLEIVHTRTGYPHDMLGPELDLEADLSIDSIKRVEIIGALADRIGLPQDADGSAESAVEELSRLKTLSGIVDWVTSHAAAPADGLTADAADPAGAADDGRPARAPEPAASAPGPLSGPAGPAVSAAHRLGAAPAGPAGPAGRGPGVRRLRMQDVALAGAVAEADGVRGLRVGVVDDGQGVSAALGTALREHGADVQVLAAADAEGAAGLDGIVDLSGLRAGAEPVLPGAFPALQRALTGGIRRLLLATTPGAAPGAGLHGFARSAALEFPGSLVRAVEVSAKEDPERVAAQLLAELGDVHGGLSSVGYTAEGVRITRRPVPAPLPRPGDTAGDGTPPLDARSVVLLTGGARGITARTALALARATGCHIELVGRTPRPAAGADRFAQATDRVALRAALIADGLRKPAEIEAAASRILAEREVRATLSALTAVAASVRYHRADVTDEQAVRAVVADVRERHGRLDGLVHGAGVLRDGLLCDKQPGDFAEVFTTKVTGARHLAAAAAEHGPGPAPRFLALFGSVSGVYGNRGQTDYAAANDALDSLAQAWSAFLPGRVLSVDWGPWAAEAGGMVTPELERAYARRGVPLLSAQAATAAFLAELAYGSDVQVVLTAREGEGDE
ncbi:SDR family NAD(P)-dependent oxidoreductase, partial [Streptomyces sp. NPDC057686]|uniref:SDR family NAD(P)-dependent oxidoreductase n=1 Tax=Streptomyces sp. NPDC057686 TaxID=3346212 RepID=UPI00367C619E